MKPLIDLRILAIILMVFFSCGTNIVFLELIIRQTPGAGNIIHFAQIAIISLDGFIFTTRCGQKQSTIPLKQYILLVIHFFAVGLANSYASVFNIPMPLIMIFRSGSLIANLILGVLILKRSYSVIKYTSVIIITLGIIICTFASVKEKSNNESLEVNSSLDWTVGIILMLFSLFASANMGVFQERLCQKYGKHPRETLFYTHLLQFPGFILLFSNIVNSVVVFNTSEPFVMQFLFISISIPKLWLYLVMNCLTQYICINSVFVLTTECTSLTVTLVVTLRKFLSLIFSIFYFQNPFTSSHWLGTALVFVGTFLFVDIHSKVFKLKVK